VTDETIGPGLRHRAEIKPAQDAPMPVGGKTVKTVWIVRWRGFEEEWPSPQDAMDRWDRLDALGIQAKVFEVVAGWRREIRMVAGLPSDLEPT
jgi:hypothetical protein